MFLQTVSLGSSEFTKAQYLDLSYSAPFSPQGGTCRNMALGITFMLTTYTQCTHGNQFSETAACHWLEKAILDISEWMFFNKLKLNQEKT